VSCFWLKFHRFRRFVKFSFFKKIVGQNYEIKKSKMNEILQYFIFHQQLFLRNRMKCLENPPDSWTSGIRTPTSAVPHRPPFWFLLKYKLLFIGTIHAFLLLFQWNCVCFNVFWTNSVCFFRYVQKYAKMKTIVFVIMSSTFNLASWASRYDDKTFIFFNVYDFQAFVL
jgi:hypothetical protein